MVLTRSLESVIVRSVPMMVSGKDVVLQGAAARLRYRCVTQEEAREYEKSSHVSIKQSSHRHKLFFQLSP